MTAAGHPGPDRTGPTDPWPLGDLRLVEGDLDLRPVDDAAMVGLASLLPDDLELDPSFPRFADLDERAARAVLLRQTYWHAYGTWTPEAWHLHFAVRVDGELVGEQELEGDRFPVLRTVDTSSWLVPAARGRGHGRRMRRAVLEFAFRTLGARAAITSAWWDNHASLGVSRALGYVDNGVSLYPRGAAGELDTMTHLRLPVETWPGAPDVVITGAEASRPLFGR